MEFGGEVGWIRVKLGGIGWEGWRLISDFCNFANYYETFFVDKG